jgi:DNA-binding transcriptional MerR regulator
MTDELLTIEETSARLRVPVATLRYWRHIGTGPTSFRMGRRVFYRAVELDRYVNELAGAIPA